MRNFGKIFVTKFYTDYPYRFGNLTTLADIRWLKKTFWPNGRPNHSFLRSYPSLKRSIFILILPVLLVACQVRATATPFDPPVQTRTTLSSPWYQIYFTDPTGPGAKGLRGGPDKHLADAIHQARMSVDIAAYQLDLWSIRDALLDAHQRGVSVRMVTESDNSDSNEIQALKDAGIPVLGDRREGLMHNKFVVIDGQDVWTGSMNYTISSAYRNNENLIHIHSPELARDYAVEFNEMFVDDRFGPGSPANTPIPKLTLGGSAIEVYFSPDDKVEKHLLPLLESAQQSIRFLAYSFTSDKIAQAMLDRAAAGVQVSGVFEENQVQSNFGTEYDRLRSAGLAVRKDGNPHSMHDKVIIIDDKIVITGSYNFTFNAENNNDENLLVIHNPDIAGSYSAEFEKIYSQAQP